MPRDVGRRFREDSEKWPTSGWNQWPRSVGMGGRLASESVAGLGRNTQPVENTVIEGFNGQFRDESLIAQVFMSLP